MRQKNTYWNGHGKYQKQVDELGTLVPNFGYTDNADLNMFIAACHLYYDAYNNGGCNVFDCYAKDAERYLLPTFPNMRLDAFADCCEMKIEDYINEVLEYLADKDLSRTLYVVFYDYDGKRMSLEKQTGPGWMPVSFGCEKDREQWIRQSKDFGIRMI